MKRFFKQAAVVGSECGGYQVALDGRTVRTPAGRPFVLPTRAMAEGVAGEWAAQGERVLPHTMPLTQLMSTALDRVVDRRAEIVEGVAAYAETDLVCYRAENPRELIDRQKEVWQPLLDWAMVRYDAPLKVTYGVMPESQPPEAVEALRAAVDSLDDLTLTGVQNATSLCGSLVIALALLEERLTADEAFEASQLDELFQAEKWGEDDEARKRREAMLAELRATGHYLKALREE